MGLPRKLKNFVLFNNGIAHVGEVPEVNLPKLSRKLEDYRSGGMSGTVKLDFGMEAMEMEWTAAGYMKELFTAWGTLRHDGVLLRFAGALQADDSESVDTLEVVVRGRHSEIDPGKAKAGDNTEIKIKSAISYYKLTLNGTVLLVMTTEMEDIPSLLDPQQKEHRWVAHRVLGEADTPMPSLRSLGDALWIPQDFARRLYGILTPGTTVLLSDLPGVRATPAEQPTVPVLESDEAGPTSALR